MLMESLVRENCFRKIFEIANPRNLCASKIWRCTVVDYKKGSSLSYPLNIKGGVQCVLV